MRTRRARHRARRGRTQHACASAVPLRRCVAHAHAARVRSRAARMHAARGRGRCLLVPTRRASSRSAHAIAHGAGAGGVRARAPPLCPDASRMHTQH
eukprot:1061488-Pleurochrysis_carterae.AAC.1